MVEQNSAAEQDPELGPEETPEPAGPRPPLIPPALARYAAVAGILAVLGVGAIFLVTDVIAPRIKSLGAPQAASEAKAGKAAEGPGEVMTVSDLVVNPAGTAGRRYLKVAAAIEVHDPKVLKELEARGAQVRDLLIRDLSARTLEELTDPVAKEEMRQSIVSELNDIVGAGKVGNLYFTDYVVQ